MKRRRRTAPGTAVAAFLALACQGQLDTTDATATKLEITSDSVPQGATTSVDADSSTSISVDPFAVFGAAEAVDRDTSVVTTIVLLVNRGLPSEVWADAGSGEVFLDTVATGDSVRLRLASRADSVRLLARTLRGSPAGSLKVSLHADTTRFAFPR